MKTPNIKNFDEYMAEEKEHKLTTTQLSEYLDGHNESKTFVRCESEFFRDFFDEILNNSHSTYDTYLNKFIRENYDGVHLPIEEVYSFKKQGDNNLIEEVVSRLANALRIPTIYIKNSPRISQEEFREKLNEMLTKGKPGDSINLTSEDYLLSIDFLGEDECFANINEYASCLPCSNVCDRGSRLAEWYGVFNYFTFINPITNEELSYEEKIKLFKDFIPQYLFRTHIVRDWDFKSENVGIIYNKKTGQYRLAPMFDFEYAYYKMRNGENDEKFEEDLIFGYDCFPEETHATMINFEHFNLDNFLEHMHDNSCVTTSRTKDTHKFLVKTAYDEFLSLFKEFEEAPDPEL